MNAQGKWSQVTREIAAELAAAEAPARSASEIVAAFDCEQAWRARGEFAIRTEMERRVHARLRHGRSGG